MKAYIKRHLSITKKEWNGMVVLIILIALVLAAPYVYQLLHKDSTINLKDFDKAVVQLSKDTGKQNIYTENIRTGNKIAHPVMFPFNPNNISLTQWEQLGLSEHQAIIIKHYEAKGGKFYNKNDVKKIYALTDSDYNRLEPYITIPIAEYASKKAGANQIIEINGANVAKLMQIRGIGPSFAIRIYRYKERLGGFFNKEQLKDVHGVDSLKFSAIKDEISVNPALVKKININSISFNQLRLFPCLSYKQVNAIIQYRAQHGNYGSIADMTNIAILDEVILRKIEPYLSFK